MNGKHLLSMMGRPEARFKMFEYYFMNKYPNKTHGIMTTVSHINRDRKCSTCNSERGGSCVFEVQQSNKDRMIPLGKNDHHIIEKCWLVKNGLNETIDRRVAPINVISTLNNNNKK